MLTINRYIDQAIRIGDDIRLVVIKTGSQVGIGIEAPRDVPVWREEIYQDRKRRAAAAIAARDQAEVNGVQAVRPACPQGRPAQPGAEGI